MISVGFSTQRKNVISRIIRFLTRSEVSHAWLLFDDPVFKRQMVVEASETGIVMTPYDVFAKKNDVMYVINLRHSLDAGMIAAGSLLGESYDVLGLIGTAFVLIGRWLRRKWRNPLDNTRAMFCSEFVVKVLQASSYPCSERLDPSATTPQDLLDFLRQPT